MLALEDATRIVEAIRTSGRLRQEDHLTLARALVMILDRRADFPADAEEALVQAVASMVVMTEIRRS